MDLLVCSFTLGFLFLFRLLILFLYSRYRRCAPTCTRSGRRTWRACWAPSHSSWTMWLASSWRRSRARWRWRTWRRRMCARCSRVATMIRIRWLRGRRRSRGKCPTMATIWLGAPRAPKPLRRVSGAVFWIDVFLFLLFPLTGLFFIFYSGRYADKIELSLILFETL